MSDLISRSELISIIESEYREYGDDYDIEQILGDIEDMPTAYDINKVVEELNELDVKSITRYKNGNFGNFDGVEYYIKKRKAIEIVKQKAEKFGTDINVVSKGWIPCSERLPEEELEKAKKERGSNAVFPVLATINKKHVVTGEKYTTVNRAFYGCYNDKNFYNSCCDKLDVIAWQPLPEPFMERD